MKEFLSKIDLFADLGDVELDRISSRLERGMTFLDGSSEKTWRLTVSPKGSTEFTEEILPWVRQARIDEGLLTPENLASATTLAELVFDQIQAA